MTGNSYEHRRSWIRERLEFLASVFAIDCLTFSVMHNHIHLVLRSRADVVAEWSDEEVARRWLRLFPRRRNGDGSPADPSKPELDMILNQPEVLSERRIRLSDISWWMRCTAENIARRSNAEDEVRGHFWEGRYRAQILLDESSLLVCAAYVDLNPIRAALAETPETSDYTGAKDRIDDLGEREDRSRPSTHDWERSRARQRSGWMSPIEIDEQFDATGPMRRGRRSIRLDAGRAARDSCRYRWRGIWSCSIGRVVSCVPIKSVAFRSILKWNPILQRIGLDSHGWCDVVRKFGRIFTRAAGTPASLAGEACRRGQGWLCARENPLGLTSV